MSVDFSTTADTTTGDGGTQPDMTTGASEPTEATAIASESTATSTEGQDTASAATPDSGAETLTTADTTTQMAQPNAAAARNWEKEYQAIEKRHKDATRWGNENNQKRLQLEKQLEAYKDIKPDEISLWKRQQAEAQAKDLPKWDRKNPANARFSNTLTKWDSYRRAVQMAKTPEQRQALDETLGRQFNEDDFKDIESWEAHQREFSASMAADPAGTIDERARAVAREEFQTLISQFQQHNSANSTIEQDFNGALKPILENPEYAKQFEQTLRSGVPYDVAKQMVMQAHELDSLRSRVRGADKATASVTEQQRLLKGNASVTRDPKTSTSIDPIAVAKERGVKPGTPAYTELLMELSESNLL